MNILIVGSGAREHAIARALQKSPKQKTLYCLATNTNPGLQELCSDLQIIDLNDNAIISQFARDKEVSLAIIGPENPLANGLTDILMGSNIKVVGPTKEHSKIESSKSFARNLLVEYKIPACPKYKIFNSMKGVQAFLDQLGDNFVIKYDGLAGGKGVKVSGDHLDSHKEALQYCEQLIRKGGPFLVEEKLVGEEFSLMSFSDGNNLKHMPAIQDHKRALEGDMGPNTGGMGTYSDADHSLPFLTKKEIKEAQKINNLTAAALKDKYGYGYKGVLYGGFIATSHGIKLIEYNARFGDPEAMNVLSLLDTDFIDICLALTDGTLKNIDVNFLNMASVCKYAVPKGYPDNPIKDEEINIEKINNTKGLFYASVNSNNDKIMLAGSRAVAVVALADTLSTAEAEAEKEISCIKGPLFHRKDIGKKFIIQQRVEHMRKLR